MTTHAATELAALLQRTRYLLLDFDGPICAIFACRPASDVARELVHALREDGHSVPKRVDDFTDPFDVLRFAGTLGPAATERTHDRLRATEVEAARTATPTPHAAELIRTWRGSGRLVAAVSNNSKAAVDAYLAEHDIGLDLVIGRTSPNPALLKPNPHLVVRAIDSLRAGAEEAVLLGDSPSDIEAGARAGIATIGYANKPGKHQLLTDAGAHSVVDKLQPLARASRIAWSCARTIEH